jgi:hypothetical protein
VSRIGGPARAESSRLTDYRFRAFAPSERATALATFRSPGIGVPATFSSRRRRCVGTESAYAIRRLCTRRPVPRLRRRARLPLGRASRSLWAAGRLPSRRSFRRPNAIRRDGVGGCSSVAGRRRDRNCARSPFALASCAPTEAQKRLCGRWWADRSRRGMGSVVACVGADRVRRAQGLHQASPRQRRADRAGGSDRRPGDSAVRHPRRAGRRGHRLGQADPDQGPGDVHRAEPLGHDALKAELLDTRRNPHSARPLRSPASATQPASASSSSSARRSERGIGAAGSPAQDWW